MQGCGNLAAVLRTVGIPSQTFYDYVRVRPEARAKLTLARELYHDELTSRATEMAFVGIPEIRRGERGRIVHDNDGKPVFDRTPNPQLIAALLKDSSERMAREAQATARREALSSFGAEDEAAHRMIENDHDPLITKE